MRALASALILLLGPASVLADGRSELDILRARCTEQERQIRTLETEIESLHSHLALERRRARGLEPSTPLAYSATPAPAPTYTVKPGDTLSSIARRYRASADGLMKINGIEDPTRLRVGQLLTLPAEAKAPKPVPASAAPAPKPVQVHKPEPKAATKPTEDYKVQHGDTLYGIARRHKMSVGDLKSFNPKIEERIVAGQSIVVISKPKKATPPNLGISKTRTIAAPKSAPKKSITKKPATSKPAPIKKKTPAPKLKPVIAGKKKEPKAKPAPIPKTISTIIVMEELSFGDFAKKYGTTPEQLNSLNGWDFKASLVLARGSEIYVPGR
ncbi:MAG: LysM peptidoglycan-binding domain-containing protein [Akkermansiaceae bacterium]